MRLQFALLDLRDGRRGLCRLYEARPWRQTELARSPRPHRTRHRRRAGRLRHTQLECQVVVVAMGNEVAPTSAPKYGTINGYAVVENERPPRATLINQWLNGGVVSPIPQKT